MRCWRSHLALAPGKQQELADKALRMPHRFALHAVHSGNRAKRTLGLTLGALAQGYVTEVYVRGA